MAGSAIGLGNIWRFPYLVGQNGGAAFVIVYILACAVLALPMFFAESIIGRRGRGNTFGAMERLAPGTRWKWVGLLTVLTPIILLGYYSVVGGWSVDYLWKACTGAFANDPRGLFGSFKSNATYGGAEGPIIQNNGDPCVDNLYTQPFALLGLTEAARATSNDANRKEYETYLRKLTDFIVKTQQVSDVCLEFDGVWFRAFDYGKWETYGSDGDLEWGVWTTESGWTEAWLNSGISMKIENACLWDLSKSVDLTDDFAVVKELMLKEIVDDGSGNAGAER